MPTSTKLKISIAIILIFGAALFWLTRKSYVPSVGESVAEEWVAFKDPDYGIAFSAPKEWGKVEIGQGNSVCPEEDTYRTGDTLNIFDREYKFKEAGIPGSPSTIRSGIRVYKFDPNLPPTCNEGLMIRLAKKEILGPELSSVRLSLANLPGFYGVRNEDASRLDTEGRSQYLLFIKESETSVLAIQPYMSFVPHANSPEWQEIDSAYQMNMLGYIQKGKTAGPVRDFQAKFRKVVESIRIK